MNRSVLIALVLGLGVAGWILSGQLEGDRGNANQGPAQTEPAAPEHALVTVRGRRSVAQPRRREIVVRAHTEAVRTVDIRAETYGRVVEVMAEEGARVKAGDVLVRLRGEDRAARLAQAKALLAQRQIEYDAARALKEKGYRAETNLAGAKAALDAAEAAVEAMRTEIGHTVVTAPFDAVVERRDVEIGAYLKVGDSIAMLVDENPFLVVGALSEQDVGAVRVGTEASARVLDGLELSGRIRFIATVADPSTRTFRVELEVDNAEHRLRAGLTSEIRILVDKVPAHFVSPALLTLNDAGIMGVRSVNAEGLVAFHEVKIVADTPEGVWLAGLPDELMLITVGQDFVRQGDHVLVQIEDSPSS